MCKREDDDEFKHGDGALDYRDFGAITMLRWPAVGIKAPMTMALHML